MVLEITTDASYCQHTQIAVCGYHLQADGQPVIGRIYSLGEVVDNIEAEVWAIYFGLNDLPLGGVPVSIIIHTDQLNLPNRLTSTKQRNQTPAMTALRSIMENISGEGHTIKLKYVKSHTKPNHGKEAHHYNRIIDQACRKTLREQRQNYKPEYKTDMI
jgi:hypothetical protein